MAGKKWFSKNLKITLDWKRILKTWGKAAETSYYHYSYIVVGSHEYLRYKQ